MRFISVFCSFFLLCSVVSCGLSAGVGDGADESVVRRVSRDKSIDRLNLISDIIICSTAVFEFFIKARLLPSCWGPYCDQSSAGAAEQGGLEKSVKSNFVRNRNSAGSSSSGGDPSLVVQFTTLQEALSQLQQPIAREVLTYLPYFHVKKFLEPTSISIGSLDIVLAARHQHQHQQLSLSSSSSSELFPAEADLTPFFDNILQLLMMNSRTEHHSLSALLNTEQGDELLHHLKALELEHPGQFEFHHGPNHTTVTIRHARVDILRLLSVCRELSS
ncbi:hypothetical protein BZA70DRAFT_270472 [Myxozyma melibiosi]|uniref:Uncharacterized protein n=1 Tax=Myxozyma melibiosi TaxID=54550 RepID=A0ABR1FB61_9ASCO